MLPLLLLLMLPLRLRLGVLLLLLLWWLVLKLLLTSLFWFGHAFDSARLNSYGLLITLTASKPIGAILLGLWLLWLGVTTVVVGWHRGSTLLCRGLSGLLHSFTQTQFRRKRYSSGSWRRGSSQWWGRSLRSLFSLLWGSSILRGWWRILLLLLEVITV